MVSINTTPRSPKILTQSRIHTCHRWVTCLHFPRKMQSLLRGLSHSWTLMACQSHLQIASSHTNNSYLKHIFPSSLPIKLGQFKKGPTLIKTLPLSVCSPSCLCAPQIWKWPILSHVTCAKTCSPGNEPFVMSSGALKPYWSFSQISDNTRGQELVPPSETAVGALLYPPFKHRGR